MMCPRPQVLRKPHRTPLQACPHLRRITQRSRTISFAVPRKHRRQRLRRPRPVRLRPIDGPHASSKHTSVRKAFTEMHLRQKRQVDGPSFVHQFCRDYMKAERRKPSGVGLRCNDSPEVSCPDTSTDCAQATPCEPSRDRAAMLTKSVHRSLAARHDTRPHCEHGDYDTTHRWMAPDSLSRSNSLGTLPHLGHCSFGANRKSGLHAQTVTFLHALNVLSASD
jgi:hypothetical protein